MKILNTHTQESPAHLGMTEKSSDISLQPQKKKKTTRGIESTFQRNTQKIKTLELNSFDEPSLLTLKEQFWYQASFMFPKT